MNGLVTPRDVADLLPFRGLRDGWLVGEDFGLAAFLRVMPGNPIAWDGERREARREQLASWLDSLPEGTRVQVLWTVDERPPCALDASSPEEGSCRAPALRRYVEERRARLRSAFGGSGLRRVECHVILGRACPIGMAERSREARMRGAARSWRQALLGRADEDFRWSVDAWRGSVTHAEEAVAQAQRAFEGWGWSPTRLDDDAILAVLHRHLGRASVARGEDPPRSRAGTSPASLLAAAPLSWDPRGPGGAGVIRMDGCSRVLLTADLPPVKIFPDHLASLLERRGGAACEVLVTLRPTPLDPRLRRLEREARRAAAKPGAAEAARREELEAELTELGRRRGHLWRAATYVHAWAADESTLPGAVGELRAWASSLEGMRLVAEDVGMLTTWRASLPGWLGGGDPHREHDFTSRQIAGLLPLLEEGEGGLAANARAALPLETRSRTVFVPAFAVAGAGGSPHVLVTGASGSGKSVFTADILAHAADAGARVVVLDFLSSYRALAEAGGWTHVEVSRTATQTLVNPLALGTRPGEEPDRDSMAAAVAFCARLISGGEGDGRLPADERSLLEDRILAVLSRAGSTEPTLGDLRDELSRHRSTERLAARLARATGRGTLAALFDGPSSLDLAAPGLVFDLAPVADDPELGALAAAAVLQAASQAARATPGGRVILVFEEFARLARDPGLYAFAEAAFRVHRKLGIVDIGVSQTIDDFAPGGAAGILANAGTVVMFRQPSLAAVAALGRSLGLTEVERQRVAALETVPASHASFLVRETGPGGARSISCLLRPSRFGWALTTTTPADLARRRVLEQRLGSLLAAVEALAAEEPATPRSQP